MPGGKLQRTEDWINYSYMQAFEWGVWHKKHISTTYTKHEGRWRQKPVDFHGNRTDVN